MSAEGERRAKRLADMAGARHASFERWYKGKHWRYPPGEYIKPRALTLTIIDNLRSGKIAAHREATKPVVEMVTSRDPRFPAVIEAWRRIGQRLLRSALAGKNVKNLGGRIRDKTYLSDGHWLLELPQGMPLPEGTEDADVGSIMADSPVTLVEIDRIPTSESVIAYRKWRGGNPLSVGSALTARLNDDDSFESGVNPFYLAMMLAYAPRAPFRQKRALSPLFKGGEYGDPLMIVMPMRLD